MLRTDSHIHLFETGLDGTAEKDSELTSYLEIAAANNVSLALVVGYEGSQATAGNNDYILACSRRHGWLKPLSYVPSDRDPTPDFILSQRRRGFVGFSIYLESRSNLAGWDPRTLGAVSETESVVSVNLSPGELPLLDAVLPQLAGARVIVSHLGGLSGQGDVEAPAALLAMADRPQLAVKVSGLYGMAAYPHEPLRKRVLDTISVFGPDRVFWGSDFAPALTVLTMEQLMRPPEWLTEALPETTNRRLLGSGLPRFTDLAERG